LFSLERVVGGLSEERIEERSRFLGTRDVVHPDSKGCLNFFAIDRIAGFERLVVLVVYKKKSRKVPAVVLETARRRRRQWEEGRKTNDLD